ncbi:MAG: DUF6452 family protein [Prevotella sp.]|nr:DUF6452 family protein [Prevotella sp.]
MCRKTVFLGALTLVLGACDSIDCSLDNQVLCQMAFYDAQGRSVTLADTLTITAQGTDSILWNRGTETSQVGLPLSYYQAADTLLLTVTGEDYVMSDQIIIEKENYEHFESLDCPVKMMHRIQRATATNYFIDSVVVVNPEVVYSNGENIKIYVHTDP